MRNNLKISTVAILTAMLVAGSASAATITVGGNGGLLGTGNGDGSTVNAAVNSGAGNANDAAADVNLNDANAHTVALDLGNAPGPGGTTGTVDLGGTNQPNSANVNLGGNGGTNGSVLLDLFGSGAGGTTGDVALNTGGVGTDGVVLDLFGNGNDGSGGANGTNGSNGGNGTNGGGNGMSGSSAIRVAAANANGKCFAPNAAQIEKLANRHVYGDATVNGWGNASQLRVIDVGLCKSAGTAISSDANVDRLQSLVAGNAGLKASLSKSGRAPNDVIAVDKNGQTLTVYVM